MNRSHFAISAGAIMLGALIYSAASFTQLAAILTPAIVHELGHIVTLRLFGLRIRRFSADVRGFCIEYGGVCSPLRHAAAALAGPAAGIAYAFAASYYGRQTGNEVLTLSAGVSLLLSAFNLLPVMPLDGGRVFAIAASELLGARRGERLARRLGLVVSVALLFAGTWLMWNGKGGALILAAVWLLISQPENDALVKRKELL